MSVPSRRNLIGRVNGLRPIVWQTRATYSMRWPGVSLDRSPVASTASRVAAETAEGAVATSLMSAAPDGEHERWVGPLGRGVGFAGGKGVTQCQLVGFVADALEPLGQLLGGEGRNDVRPAGGQRGGVFGAFEAADIGLGQQVAGDFAAAFGVRDEAIAAAGEIGA